MTSGVSSDQTTLNVIRVLIVEDEYILARNLQEGLESLGYDVLGIIDSGEGAVKVARDLRPNIVLMDIRIRGEMDGIQAAEIVWQQLQIPVIYVTGHSDQSTVERATLTFPFGYILKPIREKELHVAIQTALSRYEREQFFSTVLQSMGDGVIVVDPELRIKYFNSTAETLTGWTLNEVKEQVVVEVLPFLDECNQTPIAHPIILALQRQTTLYLRSDVLLVCKNGTTLPVADSVALLRTNDGVVTGAVLVFRDDTQRRFAEERDRANEQAQQTEIQLANERRLNRLKDEFLETTSHELRTPLSNIKTTIWLLEAVLNQQGLLSSENGVQSQSITRYLEILREQCDQELNLVNDLLLLRSLKADAYPLNLITIQLQHWIPHIAENFQARITTQQQTLQISIPQDTPPLISDLPGLTRIISELLNNACKYTLAGERIVVEVQVEREEEADKTSTAQHPIPNIVIQIKNSGVAISPEHLFRIFDPFYRIPQNDPWRHGGTGLGLALVRKLVDRLQGTITATNYQNWIIFTVRLPLREFP